MESRITTIDDLPEAVLVHILSFLPTNKAVTTTAVSRRWRNLWHSVPILHFSAFEFPLYVSDKTLRDARQLFVEFISQTILHRPRRSPLEKFYLFLDYKSYDSIRAYVNSWVRFVVSSKAAELELHFEVFSVHPLFSRNENEVYNDAVDSEQDEDDYGIYDYYNFHFSDLINSSVKVLKLHGCNFRLPANALGMKFDSIREIHLQEFYSTEEEIENLMALCVNVEFLSLGSIYDLASLKVVSPKLKILKLGHLLDYKTSERSVEICAPSLASIIFDYFFVGKYTMEDTSSLVEAHVNFHSRSWWDFACWTNVVSQLSGVERLTIQNMWMWFEFDLEEESIDGNDAEVEKQQEVESNEEPLNWKDKLHGKVLDYPFSCMSMSDIVCFLKRDVESLIVLLDRLKLGEEVFSETFVFNNLKSLELLTGYSRYDILGLEIVFEICPKLENTVLSYSYQSNLDEQFGKEMTERSIVLQIPCLRLVKMKNYKGSKNELFVVDLLKKHRVVLEKIVAYPAKVGETSSPPFVL